MRFIASGLGFDAHLACIEIILDRVSIAHLVVLVLRVIVYLPEQAVGGHAPAVVHPHRTVHGRQLCHTVDVAAAQKRQPITRVKRIFQQQYSTAVTQRGAYSSGTTTSNEMLQGLANQCKLKTKLERRQKLI